MPLVYARTDGPFQARRGAFLADAADASLLDASLLDASYGPVETHLHLDPGNVADDQDVIAAAKSLGLHELWHDDDGEVIEAYLYLSPNLLWSPLTQELYEELLDLLLAQGFHTARVSDCVVPQSWVLLDPRRLTPA